MSRPRFCKRLIRVSFRFPRPPFFCSPPLSVASTPTFPPIRHPVPSPRPADLLVPPTTSSRPPPSNSPRPTLSARLVLSTSFLPSHPVSYSVPSVSDSVSVHHGNPSPVASVQQAPQAVVARPGRDGARPSPVVALPVFSLSAFSSSPYFPLSVFSPLCVFNLPALHSRRTGKFVLAGRDGLCPVRNREGP